MSSLLLSRDILRARTREIRLYFNFLNSIINHDANLYLPQKKKTLTLHKDLSHTLKANGYLLLYNAVEAVCSNAFNDIHSSVENELKNSSINISVEKMNINLMKQVLTRFKASLHIDYTQLNPQTGMWIIEQWINDHKKEVAKQKNPLMSGNLDSRQMRELAEKYGFNSYGNLEMPKNKGPQNAKIQRNNLAHGHQSFADCGRDLTYQDVARDAIGVVIYLRRYVSAVENYIQQKGYLAQPPALAPQPELA